MKKIKQFADKATFAMRPSTSSVPSSDTLNEEEFSELERRIDRMKITCEYLVKRISACIDKSNSNLQLDKRIRKVPEYLLGASLTESAKQNEMTSLINNAFDFGTILQKTGEIEMKLGQTIVEYEVSIEKLILRPIQLILENDFASIHKLKKSYGRSASELESIRLKLNQAQRHSMINGQYDSKTNGPMISSTSSSAISNNPSSTSSSGSTSESNEKIEALKEEESQAKQKMETVKTNLLAEVYGMISREREISARILEFLTLQSKFYESIHKTLNDLQPEIVNTYNFSNVSMFGRELDDYLSNHEEGSLSLPIEYCVCCILTMKGHTEEGLFRVEGGKNQIRLLKSHIDSGLINFKLMHKSYDIHTISSVLKLYLRKLPYGLLNGNENAIKNEEWLEWSKLDNEAKEREFKRMFANLSPNYQENYKYLVRFFKLLLNYQTQNKMNCSNICIVIGPNLLSCSDADGGNENSLYSTGCALLEFCIKNFSELFQNDEGEDYFLDPKKYFVTLDFNEHYSQQEQENPVTSVTASTTTTTHNVTPTNSPSVSNHMHTVSSSFVKRRHAPEPPVEKPAKPPLPTELSRHSFREKSSSSNCGANSLISGNNLASFTNSVNTAMAISGSSSNVHPQYPSLPRTRSRIKPSSGGGAPAATTAPAPASPPIPAPRNSLMSNQVGKKDDDEQSVNEDIPKKPVRPPRPSCTNSNTKESTDL